MAMKRFSLAVTLLLLSTAAAANFVEEVTTPATEFPSVVVQALPQPPVFSIDELGTGTVVTTQRELTESQVAHIVDVSTKKAKLECLNRYSAGAFAGGVLAGNLVTRGGSLLEAVAIAETAGVGMIFYVVYKAVKEAKVRKDCAVAAAAIGALVSYFYFKGVYDKPAEVAPNPTTPPPAAPAAPVVPDALPIIFD